MARAILISPQFHDWDWFLGRHLSVIAPCAARLMEMS